MFGCNIVAWQVTIHIFRAVSFHAFSTSNGGQLIRSNLAFLRKRYHPGSRGSLLKCVAKRFPVLRFDSRLGSSYESQELSIMLCSVRFDWNRFLTTSWSFLVYSQDFEVLADISLPLIRWKIVFTNPTSIMNSNVLAVWSTRMSLPFPGLGRL